jgi:hypothetical protein
MKSFEGCNETKSNSCELSKLSKEKLGSSTIDVKKLDAPLAKDVKKATEAKVEGTRMTEQVQVEFKCPQGMDKREFTRQVKGQERGLNSMTVGKWIDNRDRYKARAEATGNGRSPEGHEAQRTQREKAYQSRIESNQKKGLSYSEAKQEASQWISTKAALHNPDQIAGGDPSWVSRVGDAGVNSSIGSQWKNLISGMETSIKQAASKMTVEELATTKLNIKLTVEG